MKPLGDAFIKLVRMIIAPVVFCTVVVGIAGVGDVKAVGKAGILTLLYFEIVSTVALVIGLIVVNVVKPGAGMNVDPATLDAGAVAQYVTAGRGQSVTDFLLGIIPTSAADAFAKSDILRCCSSRSSSASRSTRQVRRASQSSSSSSACPACSSVSSRSS
jgi:aerobic C4-dicarboxylate transport protein